MGKYLIFQIDGNNYAIPISALNEIIEFVDFTKLPKSSRSLLGVINHRGSITPILDISVKLDSNKTPNNYTKNNRIIIVNKSNKQMGLAVDSTSKIIDIDESKINKSSYNNKHIEGLIEVKDVGLVIVLNLDNLIS